jgi:acetyl-CoA carboxylase carboxyl transferase subunit alpha
MKLTAADLLHFGMTDEVVPEPPGGSHLDPEATMLALKPRLRLALQNLLAADIDTLLQDRHARYRAFV